MSSEFGDVARMSILPLATVRRPLARAATMLLLGLSLGACSNGFDFFHKNDVAPD